MRRLSFSALLLTLAVLLGAPAVSRAADDQCSFASRFAELKAVQEDGSRNYADAIRAQLVIRKSILKGIIDCALKDVRARQDALKKVPTDMQDPKIQSDLTKGLQDAADYYARQRASVDDLGIKGTQDMAHDIATWRIYNYAPLAARQDSFQIWMQNQPFFTKTEARFAQIRPVVLSLSVLNHDEVQSAFKDAEDKFDTAKDANAKAKDALENGDDNAPQLVKASLEPLSDIYKKFMSLSDQIKKIVP